MNFKTIPTFTTPLGTYNKDTGEIVLSKEWYNFFQMLYNLTNQATLSTQDAALLESAEIDQPRLMEANGITGAQTATFTATNKPGTGTTTPDLWIPMPVNGVVHYFPVWK